jgi:endonuclease/exonuclease/phosphatase family metal-dependent hydrolase
MMRAVRLPPRRRIRSLVLVVVAVAGLATAVPARGVNNNVAPAAWTRITVMEFNIEYGGEVVEFSSVIRAIRASGADVVGIEEAWGNTARIAHRLGWDYSDRRLQIVSRLPLIDPPGADGLFTFVQTSPGRVVAIGNVHLPSYPYSPQRILQGASASEARAYERDYRLPALRPSVRELSALAASGIPSFLLGDFNSPSHLDWTRATVGSSPQIRFPMRWPVTELVARRGFRDSYREAHPDPLRKPGLTWPSGRPRPAGAYNPGPHAARDRIDFIFAAGAARTVRSTLAGESGAAGVGIEVDPWPSDHRAVVSTFDVRGGVPPTLVAVSSRLVTSGDNLAVTFHAPGDVGEHVSIARVGPSPETVVADQPTGSDHPTDGELAFNTGGLAAGAYCAVLSGTAGELSRSPFWVEAADAGPRIGTTEAVYPVGAPIAVEWHSAPGNRWDWVGMYEAGADPMVDSYIEWLYTGSTIDGSARFDRDAHGAWPLRPGDYSVFLLEDDAYRAVASGTFSVVAG